MSTFNKLMLFSMGGLMVTLGMKEIFVQRVSNHIKESSLFKEAMEILRQHKGAIHFLGQPIEDHRASFTNSGFLFNDTSDVKVKVSGPKSTGIAFVTVASEQNEKLFLNSIQLQIGKDDSKRLIVKKALEEERSES